MTDGKITETGRDPFAFAREGAEGDDRVLALFHDWREACREMDRHVGDSEGEKYQDAYELREDLEEQIIAIPGGPVALAVKIYLHQKIEDCSYWAPDLAMLRCPSLLKGNPGITVSMLRDAAALVPELAELAAPVIHEDAVLINTDIEIQWCRETGDAAEAARRLPAVLVLIAQTPAKTERGEAIKAKHANIVALLG